RRPRSGPSVQKWRCGARTVATSARTTTTTSWTRGSARSGRRRNWRGSCPRFQASWGTASSSEWRVSSSWRPAKASERCALRERLEPLAVRLDPLDLRLFLTVDGGEDLGRRDTQAVRMLREGVAWLCGGGLG